MSIKKDIEYLTMFFQSVEDLKVHQTFLRVLADVIKNNPTSNKKYVPSCQGCKFLDVHNKVCIICIDCNMFTPKQA